MTSPISETNPQSIRHVAAQRSLLSPQQKRVIISICSISLGLSLTGFGLLFGSEELSNSDLKNSHNMMVSSVRYPCIFFGASFLCSAGFISRYFKSRDEGKREVSSTLMNEINQQVEQKVRASLMPNEEVHINPNQLETHIDVPLNTLPLLSQSSVSSRIFSLPTSQKHLLIALIAQTICAACATTALFLESDPPPDPLLVNFVDSRVIRKHCAQWSFLMYLLAEGSITIHAAIGFLQKKLQGVEITMTPEMVETIQSRVAEEMEKIISTQSEQRLI